MFMFNVLQIADRLLTSFGQDIMDAFTLTVQESCENWNAAAEARRTAAAAPQSVPVPEPVAEPEPSPSPSVRHTRKDSEGDLRQRRPFTTGQSTRPASTTASASASANAEGADRTLTSEELEAELPDTDADADADASAAVDDDDNDRAVPEARARAREEDGVSARRTLPTRSPTNAPPPAPPRASGSSATPPPKARSTALYSLLDILPHFGLAALYVTLHSMLFLAQVRKCNVRVRVLL